jgi:hypothetical protein
MLADCGAGDILLCMSNGPFEGLPKRLFNALSAK